MSKKSSITLSLSFLIAAFLSAESHAAAQGLISTESPTASPSYDGLIHLPNVSANEIATIQRLLRRLGYLGDDDMTRKLDARTSSAILAHFKDAGLKPQATGKQVIRSLFTKAWIKEEWGLGKVAGQDVVVEPEEVRAAQKSLKQLGYAPGPADGTFGPATFSAVELFQQDNVMKVTGLLSRNTHQSILRRTAMREQQPVGVVRMLNWPDYIDPDVLIQFEKETNIKVVHEVFESSDETVSLLMAKSPLYDVLVQTDGKMKQLVDNGDALAALDLAKLPNAQHLDPRVMRYTAQLDPENKHSLPYMWGTVGIAVNESKVRKISSKLDYTSMDLFLDPDIAARLSKCGLAVVDEAVDVMPLIVAHLGGNILDIQPGDLAKVDAAVSKVATYVTAVSADRFIDDVAKGKYCVAIGYSGDVFLARDTAKETGIGKISYHVPSSGSLLWFDRLVISKSARNVSAAYKLIDFLMRPKIAAANTNFLQYANPNVASAPFIEPALLNDPGLYPPKEVMNRLAVMPPISNETTAEINRIWGKLKRE